MKKRMKMLLCALCVALLLCLTPFTALCEGWELKLYADENGKQIKELYDQTGALVAKATINLTPDGPVYEAREGTLQESTDENGNLIRSYVTVGGIQISEQYQEGSLVRIDYDKSGDGAYEKYYDDGMKLYFFTADGTEVYKYYEEYRYLSYECHTYADGTDLQMNYRENHALSAKFYTNEEGKSVGEYYNEKGKIEYSEIEYTDAEGKEFLEFYDGRGKLQEYTVEYTDANGCHVEEAYLGNKQLRDCTIYKDGVLQREEMYDVDSEAGYYLMELSIGYQENGVHYIATEYYTPWKSGKNKGLDRFSLSVSHEEDGKKITCHYDIVDINNSPLGDPNYTITYPLNPADKMVKLDFTMVEFTDEAYNVTVEYYNPDGKLLERAIWDENYNAISDEFYDETWKKRHNP